MAVITGASRGLGHGLAETFRQLGLRLGLCARREPELQGARPEGLVSASVDVTDAAAVARFADQVAERLGPIDLWINNAGVLEPIAFLRDLEPEALRRHLDVNLFGAFHGTQAYVRHLRQQGRGGVLINVSSGAALKGYAGWTAYCAGKAAADRITECVQAEEADLGLKAYAVAPGVIDTAMQETIRSKTPDEFPHVQKFLDLKRDEAFNTPPFIARHLLAIAFVPEAAPAEVVVRLPAER